MATRHLHISRSIGCQGFPSSCGASSLVNIRAEGLMLNTHWLSKFERVKTSLHNPKKDFHLAVVDASTKNLSSPSLSSPGPMLESPVIDIRVVELTRDTCSFRGCSTDRLKFEVEYGLKRGTTDNSYRIRGPNGAALIDVPDHIFKTAYIQTLKQNNEFKDLKHLILGHVSPKRIESLVALGESVPDAVYPLQIYCSNPAAQLLTSTIPEPLLKRAFAINIIRAGDCLDLGGGHKLRFILTPTPRWPDGMCTYDPTNQLLFTHKLFSAHVCDGNNFDLGGWDAYGEDWQFFFECMMAPAPQQINSALEKLPVVTQFSRPSYAGKMGIEVIKTDVKYILSTVLGVLNLPVKKSMAVPSEGPLVVSALCPIHGPVVRSTITEIVREYRSWTFDRLKQTEEAVIAVVYASAYGNTAALAQAISRGIAKGGVAVESLNTEQSTTEEMANLIVRCSGFVIGSPTLAGHMPTPIQNALGVILKDTEARSKPCGVFGSFGWSGEAIDELEQRLKVGGFSFAFPTIRCKFKPTESTLQICEESGTDLAQAVKRAKRKRRANVSSGYVAASSTEQAVGRVVGSLCVLSAKDGDAESGMLASWVSQASFVPPGLTIAVAKERAIESLLLPGSHFVLNVLGEGKTSEISKQLLKPYKPGDPRFEQLSTEEAANGGKILLDAIAWMECTVQSHMETGDHWILYASVNNGELQDDKTLTAVHHRKTGARY